MLYALQHTYVALLQLDDILEPELCSICIHGVCVLSLSLSKKKNLVPSVDGIVKNPKRLFP